MLGHKFAKEFCMVLRQAAAILLKTSLKPHKFSLGFFGLHSNKQKPSQHQLSTPSSESSQKLLMADYFQNIKLIFQFFFFCTNHSTKLVPNPYFRVWIVELGAFSCLAPVAPLSSQEHILNKFSI
jgi:hypothetical protein